MRKNSILFVLLIYFLPLRAGDVNHAMAHTVALINHYLASPQNCHRLAMQEQYGPYEKISIRAAMNMLNAVHFYLNAVDHGRFNALHCAEKLVWSFDHTRLNKPDKKWFMQHREYATQRLRDCRNRWAITDEVNRDFLNNWIRQEALLTGRRLAQWRK